MKNAYWDIASALAEADGIDYSDPEEVQTFAVLVLSGSFVNMIYHVQNTVYGDAKILLRLLWNSVMLRPSC